jgi:hypothetical protein
MTEIQCKICRASNPADAAACFSCGAKFRREAESAPEPAAPATSGSRAADAIGRYASVIGSIVAMCITSYTLFALLAYMMQSMRIALLVPAALWVAFLLALALKRWLWVLCFAVFPLPALYLIFAVLARVQ